jgi:hypothetical protein
LRGPVGEGTGVGDAFVGVGLTGGGVGMLTDAGAFDCAWPPVHAARNAANPAIAEPCRKRRLEIAAGIASSRSLSFTLISSNARPRSLSMIGSLCVFDRCLVAAVDHE